MALITLARSGTAAMLSPGTSRWLSVRGRETFLRSASAALSSAHEGQRRTARSAPWKGVRAGGTEGGRVGVRVCVCVCVGSLRRSERRCKDQLVYRESASKGQRVECPLVAASSQRVREPRDQLKPAQKVPAAPLLSCWQPLCVPIEHPCWIERGMQQNGRAAPWLPRARR